MALINTSTTPMTTTLDIKPSTPTFGEYLGAAIEGTWDRNPLQLLRRQSSIYEAQYGVDQISDLQSRAEEGGLSFDSTELAPLQVKDELSLDEQASYIREKSSRLMLDKGTLSEGEVPYKPQDESKYTEQILKDYGIKPEEKLNAAALDIIMQARANDRKNADIRERAPAWMGPFGVVADFATAMVDPVNLGAGIMIPSAAVSNTYLRALQEAGEMSFGGALKRGAVRFATGAVDGVVGTAAIEPMNIGLSRSQQFEYGALDSLTNIAAGGILGGSFKSIAGRWGEYVRKKRGQRQEWHVAIPDAESEALREAFKADILRHAREVGADKIGEYEAAAAAGVWDATARTVSYDLKQATRKFYDDNPIEWRRITKEEMNSDSFGLGFVSNSDPDTRWVPGFKDIEANPYTIDYTPQAAPGDKAALPALIKSAYDENLARYKGKELPFLDENGQQQNARVSSVGLNELLRKRKMTEDDIAVANNLPNILSNTRIYRIDKANDKHGVPRSVMHGVAAVNLNGESVLVRSVFKRAKDANGEFWQYYGSNIMHGKNNDGASVSAIHQAKALHHPSETPSLGKTLYEWMSNVNDKGQRFPDDISVLEQTAVLEQRRGSNGYDANRKAEADALNAKRKVVSDEPDSLVPDTPIEAPTPDTAPSDPLRGRVAFLEDGKAVIEFFKAADATTAPHEIYHVYRRVMEKYSADVNASPTLKNDWITACEFVGAKPGEAWTREMEEKFARAGERFLMEGVAPHPSLQNTFDRMKEWFTEIYTNADEAGLEISPAMRKVFGDSLRLDASEADIAFKYHLGSMVDDTPDGNINTDFEFPERKPGETDRQYNDRLQQYENDADVQFKETMDSITEDFPEQGKVIQEEWNRRKAELDSESDALDTRRQALLEAAMCDLRKG